VIKIIGICFTLIVLLLGCKQSCINSSVKPVFVGFAPSDIDTLVIRAYKANDNFVHLIDTMLIVSAGPALYDTSGDTTVVDVGGTSDGSGDPRYNIVAGYDWQIYIPALNRTITLSQIISPQTEHAGRICWNPIKSFVLDGQFIVPELAETNKWYTSGYRAYIQY